MSHGPQMSHVVDRLPGIFETDSAIAQPRVAPAVSCPSILLVGRSGSWGALILRSLRKFRSDVSLLAPQMVTPEYARARRYSIILLDSTVPPEQRRQLASGLEGSETSVFYTFPVENGCWWLPVLRRGQDCHGTPAFRRSEFPFELERILRGPAAA